jgi:hypothetical protein
VDFSSAGSRITRALSNTCRIIEKATVQDPIISDCSKERGGHRLGSSGSCVSEAVAGATDKHLSKVQQQLLVCLWAEEVVEVGGGGGGGGVE